MDTRIPSLDGARAVSITLVFASHLFSVYNTPIVWRLDYGNLGVRIFFVISGFLITSILLTERERSGHIRVIDFYIRRFFRIIPAYYTSLALIVFVIPSAWLILYHTEWLPAAAFYANYRVPHYALAHTWSLAVEEQFYLMWPGVMVLLGLRRSLYACASLLVLAPVFRILSDVGLWPTNPERAFESVCDALACGCILAIARSALWNRPSYRRLVNSPWSVAVPLTALLVMAAKPGGVVHDALGVPLLNVGIVVMLDRYIRFPGTRFGHFLNWRPIAWVGTISYSLYLWQQPFSYNNLHLSILSRIVGTVAFAAMSYYFVESPFLALRRRLASPMRHAVA